MVLGQDNKQLRDRKLGEFQLLCQDGLGLVLDQEQSVVRLFLKLQDFEDDLLRRCALVMNCTLSANDSSFECICGP